MKYSKTWNYKLKGQPEQPTLRRKISFGHPDIKNKSLIKERKSDTIWQQSFIIQVNGVTIRILKQRKCEPRIFYSVILYSSRLLLPLLFHPEECIYLSIFCLICPFVYWINSSDCICACSMLVGLLLTGWKYTPAGAPLLEVLIQKLCSRFCASFYFLFNVPWSFVLKSHFPTLYQIVKFGFGHQCHPHTPTQFVIKLSLWLLTLLDPSHHLFVYSCRLHTFLY